MQSQRVIASRLGLGTHREAWVTRATRRLQVPCVSCRCRASVAGVACQLQYRAPVAVPRISCSAARIGCSAARIGCRCRASVAGAVRQLQVSRVSCSTARQLRCRVSVAVPHVGCSAARIGCRCHVSVAVPRVGCRCRVSVAGAARIRRRVPRVGCGDMLCALAAHSGPCL